MKNEKLTTELQNAGIDTSRTEDVAESLRKKAPIKLLGGLVTKRDVQIDYEPPRMTPYGEVPLQSTNIVETRVVGIPVSRKIEHHRGDVGHQ